MFVTEPYIACRKRRRPDESNRNRRRPDERVTVTGDVQMRE